MSLQPFNYQGKEVRTIIKDGEPWFVVTDVCKVLEHSNSRMAAAQLDDDEKGVSIIDTPGGPQEMIIVSEAGLYAFILTSRKPEAKEFKRWITHEVIPSIRKTGSYSVSPMSLEDLIILQAKSVKELKAKVDQIEQKAITAHHRIDCLDSLDTIGDLQQRLNAMVRKYAQQNGISFSQAWKDYRQAYNTAFRTNITMLLENACMKAGKKLTLPQYLSMAGKLEDAIRVADKMLNRQEVV